MKTLATILMISASVLAGAVHAEPFEVYPPEVHASSYETRAQVVAELRAAQAAGLVSSRQDVTYPSVMDYQSPKTRAQVVAELRAAQSAGLVTSGQDVTYPHIGAEQRFEAQQQAALSAGQQPLSTPAALSSASHS